MELKQSWIVTCAKGALSLYELRIIVKIVEYAQAQLKDVYIARNLKRLKKHCDDVTITIPMRYVLTDGSNHYEDVREGAIKLCRRVMQFYDSDTNQWRCSSIIYNVIHEVNRGNLTFTVYGYFLDCLFDFTHGFTRYDLEAAMAMRLPSSVRLFMLMYGQRAPKDYTIGWLKDVMGVADKYGQTADFIKKVIAPACKEITEKTSIQLDYERVREGKKVVKIQLITKPKPKQIEEKNEAENQIDVFLEKNIKTYLICDGGFTYRELSAHKELLKRLMEHPCALQIVQDVTHRARKKSKGKGYIIAAIRDEVRNM